VEVIKKKLVVFLVLVVVGKQQLVICLALVVGTLKKQLVVCLVLVVEVVEPLLAEMMAEEGKLNAMICLGLSQHRSAFLHHLQLIVWLVHPLEIFQVPLVLILPRF
jgi:hypothetical protein